LWLHDGVLLIPEFELSAAMATRDKPEDDGIRIRVGLPDEMTLLEFRENNGMQQKSA
jgi:hypothetical protein